MGKPDDIPQDVWAAAYRAFGHEPDAKLGLIVENRLVHVARAIMAERAAERERCAKAIDTANSDMPNIEVPLMKGDNLAVTLCSQFDDGGPDVDDYGWSQTAVDGYNQTVEAIREHYRKAIREGR